jgi:fermentation-respiration switch protein FrsA (DUF1100 family)
MTPLWPSLLRIALALLVCYGVLVVIFKVLEDRLVYHPDPTPYFEPPPGLPRTAVSLMTADSVKVAAWAVSPPETVPTAEAPWLLYFHGNGGNIGNPGYHDAWVMLRKLGLGLLAVDYRGYGESGGTPSEAGLYLDAEAAYAHLRDSLGVPPSRIILYGFSLGSAVAVELASRLPCAALMAEGSLLSVPHRGQELYPFLPVSLMARNRYASIDKIARVEAPKLFIHSRDDEVNPFSHGRGLFDAAVGRKEFLEVSGGHADAYVKDPRFMAGVSTFLAGLGFPAP